MMMNRFRWLLGLICKLSLCLLLFVILFCGKAATSYAETEEKKEVSVACIDYDGMLYRDRANDVYGYAPDYFQKICEDTGWKVNFVDMTWKEAYEGIKNGEVDFYLVARRSEEREESYDFSTYPLINEEMNLYVLPDKSLNYEDFNNFNGLKVGMLSGSEEIKYFKEYMEKNNFYADIVEYDTNSMAIEALHSGEVNAVAVVSYSISEDLKQIANFGFAPAYVMSSDGNALMNEFNQAQQRIMSDDSEYFQYLSEKYFPKDNKILYTQNELDYINSIDSITVGLIGDYSPISYMNEKGEPSGIVFDIINLISKKSGIKFKYKFLDQSETGYSFLSEGKGDIVAGVALSNFSKPNEKLLLSSTLFTSKIGFAGRDGMSFNSNADVKISISNGFIAGKSTISRIFPNFELIKLCNSEECLKAVRDGKADVMINNTYVLRELLQNAIYEGVEIYPAYSYDEEEKIVALPENAALLRVINKAIRVMSTNEINNIVIKNTVEKVHNQSVEEFIYKFRLPLVGIGILVFIVIGLLVFITIVRQHNYHEVRVINDKLEQSNIHLGEAVRLAEHANTAKSQFLSRMSHEIRTPINAIVGLTELARPHKTEPETVDKYLSKIDSSSHVLLGIVNDILDMSAIENNKMKISNKEFTVTEVLNQISNIYYIQCKDKGILFSSTCKLNNEVVKGDSLRLNQILLNLVSNAYKFTEKGGKINVSAQEISNDGNRKFIRFEVSDTGCGMSEDMKERLFKPFEQESAETALKSGGSGLGLSIVYNIVQLMHGAINCNSKKGAGTTFTVDIPFEISPEYNKKDLNNASEYNDSTDVIEEPNNYDFTGHRLLLVEDNKINTEVAIDLLGLVNMSVDHAADGIEAVEMFKKSKPFTYDLILMDLQMPNMNGYDATISIRNSIHEDAASIPIYAMTANAFTEDISKSLSVGMNGHFAKPIDTKLLYKTIYKIIMENEWNNRKDEKNGN